MILATALLPAAGSGWALADTITFVNGKSVQGRIVRKEDDRVVIVMDNGGRIEIPAGRVSGVSRGKPAAEKTGPRGEAATRPDRVPPGRPDKAKPEATVKPLPKVDRKVLARVERLIREMGTTEGEDALETRSEARAALVAIGEPAAGPLCEALENRAERTRLAAAVVLGRIRSKRSVRALLAAVYTGTPAKGKAPWWEERYLRACGRSFKAVTGTSFDYDPDNTLAGGVAARMLEWWGKHSEKYPLQYGEKLVEKTVDDQKVKARPDALEDIKGLSRRRYPKPVSKVRGERNR